MVCNPVPILQLHELSWPSSKFLASIWESTAMFCPIGQCYMCKDLRADLCCHMQIVHFLCGEPAEIYTELMAISQLLNASSLVAIPPNFVVSLYGLLILFLFEFIVLVTLATSFHHLAPCVGNPRSMGFYGGWSLKPQLGMSNA